MKNNNENDRSSKNNEILKSEQNSKAKHNKSNDNKKLVDDLKKTTGNVFKTIGKAAKMTVDFTGDHLKQAQVIISNSIQNKAEKNKQRNLEKYKPIFIDDIPKEYPQLIYIVNEDIRMKVSECKGAVGYRDRINGLDIMGIYHNEYKKFDGIEYLPDNNPIESVYYVHPFNKHQYISIENYFKYLHEQRVAELESIAQELGAKFFEVEIIEEQTVKTKNERKISTKLQYDNDKVDISTEKNSDNEKYDFRKSYVKMKLTGKEPSEPKLCFWSNNISIKSLIKQRLSNDNALQSKTYILDNNTSTGIKESEGARIDGVLEKLKFNISTSVKKIAIDESKRKLAYTIEF